MIKKSEIIKELMEIHRSIVCDSNYLDEFEKYEDSAMHQLEQLAEKIAEGVYND